MNDEAFETSRGTAIRKLSEEYRSKFKIPSLATMDGPFIKHLLGMYRFLGQGDKIKLNEIAPLIQRSVDEATNKRDDAIKAAIKAADEAFTTDIEKMLDDVLPYKPDDIRSPVIHDVTISEIDMQYTMSQYEETQLKETQLKETQLKDESLNG